MREGRITPDELAVLEHLAHAWSTFLNLHRDRRDDDTVEEFRHKIHDLERIVSHRAAVRVNPELR